MDPAMLESFIQQKSLKPYVPFLKLARDCLAANPIVSYWSLFYILETAIKNKNDSNEHRDFLANLMTCLEKEKNARKGDPLFASEEEAKKFIENYGNQLLVRAENDAELGVSPSVSTKLYLAAANVYMLLPLFGENTEENAKRIKYCKWKAVNLFKEAKAQPPQPPPENFEAPSGGLNNDASFFDEPSNQPSYGGSSSLSFNPPAPAPRRTSEPPEPITENEPDVQSLAGLTLSDSDLKKAELMCESALYAIQANDILTAVTTLKQTLQLLHKCARNH